MSGIPGRPGGGGAFAYRAYQFGRKLSRLPGLKALIPGRLKARLQARMFTADVIGQLPDRRYMEEVLLPTIVAMEPSRVLDVGVEGYTAHYGRWFPPESEYWTLDLNPEVAHLRPADRHIVADVMEVGSYFGPASIDVALLNGPFGHGIDRLSEQERTFEAVLPLLKPGGWLLAGWDLGPDGRPIVVRKPEPPDGERIKDPTETQVIQAHFRHEAPPGLPARIAFDGCAHVYDWFRPA